MTEPISSFPGAESWGPKLRIIFSLRDDYVWASWPDSHATVRLGPHEAVVSMMRDFLAQDDLGERLSQVRVNGS